MYSSELLMIIVKLLFTAKWLLSAYARVNFIKYKKLGSWENIKATIFNINETEILSKGTVSQLNNDIQKYTEKKDRFGASYWL